MATPKHIDADILRIVLVLREILRTAKEPYESYADLKEDLKMRCATLHLAYDATMITAALDQVEHGGRISVITPRPPRGRR